MAERLTVEDLQGNDHFVVVARKNWLKKPSPAKFKAQTLKKDIWDVLAKTDFPQRSLLLLENLQFLERYLWPNYDEEASQFHVLLIAMMVNLKRQEALPVWTLFEDNAAHFSSLFRRILSILQEVDSGVGVRSTLLLFVTNAFQSLDNGLIRKECAPLVSIGIWTNLSSDGARQARLEKHSQLRKAWRAAGKRFDAADEATKAKLGFDRLWLFLLVADFLRLINTVEDLETTMYCERFLEFLIDLISQLPTRRYVNGLLLDLNLPACIKLSALYNNPDNDQFRDMYKLFLHFVFFSIDDHLGQQLSRDEAYELHCGELAKLQRVALKHFKDKLTILALSNYALIERRDELVEQLQPLTDDELVDLCKKLHIRASYPEAAATNPTRDLLLEILLQSFERKPSFRDVVKSLNTLPTEKDIFDSNLLRNETYDGSRPLPLPKLNLQYLTVGDFLWRSYVLFRSESFFEIRKNIEDCVTALKPSTLPTGDVKFHGSSRMALQIGRPSIVEVLPPKVAESHPAMVRAEISINLGKLSDAARREWESLKPDDVVFLLAVRSPDESRMDESDGRPSVRYLRTAEVIQILDDHGRAIKINPNQVNGFRRGADVRKLQVRLDRFSFRDDALTEIDGVPAVYAGVNVIMRRRGRENNFRAILESIKSLTLSSVPIPEWLQEVFLGYGDPAGASYHRLPNKLHKVDFGDTFLDWQHLIESFPGKAVEPVGDASSDFKPPYVVETKAVGDEDDESLKVSTYRPPNSGPYPTDIPKLNSIRFTPTQIEAIQSGTQPGLTIILGPPGSGKTDVATQIISNIYHNFPEQRTLLIAHSNQALNQLFQKIINLNIDERHLLRLGHGEEDLETDSDYSKHGRVESFLDNRTTLLTEVNRLAASIGAPGAHGNSCETAGYFYAVYVKPIWTKYLETLDQSASTAEQIVSKFPFATYFSNAPAALFTDDMSAASAKEIAVGCFRHIDKIFRELADIRPFEILRMARDKANYLLIKEARVIAMTSTHAAMRRQEIADLGFRYDNIVMEEAAQITEIEAFVPLALQHPVDEQINLQRVVLCGDHLQNSPVVQNLAFRQYANLEQSLFQRFVRLGVPTIDLDQQGRARPSIAELYSWRYNSLGNLPYVETGPEYLVANAGLRFDYQFINVGPYKGAGESIPSPHFVQNLGEAEYAVALYQYMRLLGYPASKITIMATYAGQRSLIRDVIQRRCANPLFGPPRAVITVDKYQGEQNDYVILSLTRSSRVGYLRDIRRLTVALSRARLGLYILGCRELFESCYELRGFMERLLKRPDNLQLTLGEMYPTKRGINDDVDATEMQGVEHLGQYVYEMTKAKIQALKEEGVQAVEPAVVDEEMADVAQESDGDESVSSHEAEEE